MFTRIEAYNFGCLRAVNQPLDRFHVLVGPNASGKSTFLDVIGFVSDFVNEGLDGSILNRTRNFQDLVWMKREGSIQLVLEARIPKDLVGKKNSKYSAVRYELEVGKNEKNEVVVLGEAVLLIQEKIKILNGDSNGQQFDIFISDSKQDYVFSTQKFQKTSRLIASKSSSGNANFKTEYQREGDKIWKYSFKFSPRASVLSNIPDDRNLFPAVLWFRQLLSEGTQRLTLLSREIRQPSRPGLESRFRPDGSNLAWIIRNLKASHPKLFREWIEHVQTSLPDISTIDTEVREEDKHCYLIVEYKNGLRAASWTVSDGTLRMLALTLLAYSPDVEGVFLIEEPENGIHPKAIETVTQSLESVYNGQVLVASHSPIVLNCLEPEDVICFSKSSEGAARTTNGSSHPYVLGWKRNITLGTLFASGILE